MHENIKLMLIPPWEGGFTNGMKKSILLVLCCFSLLSQFSMANLILPDGTPSDDLCALFDLAGFEGKAKDIHAMITFAKKTLKRSENQERWEMKDKFEDKRGRIIPILQRMGFIDNIEPSNQKYDTIFVHGSLANTMRLRIKFLDNLWKQGVRARSIVFLTGKRKLDKKQESIDVLWNEAHSYTPFRKGWKKYKINLAKAQYESDVTKMLWDQIVTSKDLRQWPVKYRVAPEHRDGKRPTTIDTINAWIEQAKPKKGMKYLAISNNPYIYYQDLVLRNFMNSNGLLESESDLETVGFSDATGQKTPIAVHYDNLANCLYHEYKYKFDVDPRSRNSQVF